MHNLHKNHSRQTRTLYGLNESSTNRPHLCKSPGGGANLPILNKNDSCTRGSRKMHFCMGGSRKCHLMLRGSRKCIIFVCRGLENAIFLYVAGSKKDFCCMWGSPKCLFYIMGSLNCNFGYQRVSKIHFLGMGVLKIGKISLPLPIFKWNSPKLKRTITLDFSNYAGDVSK